MAHAHAQLRPVERFVQVGFPPDGAIAKLRVPPRWTDDDLRMRVLPSATGDLHGSIASLSALASSSAAAAPPTDALPLHPATTAAGTAFASRRSTVDHAVLSFIKSPTDAPNMAALLAAATAKAAAESDPAIAARPAPADDASPASAAPAATVSGTDGAPSTPSHPALSLVRTRTNTNIGAALAADPTSPAAAVNKKPPHPVEFSYLPTLIDCFPPVEEGDKTPDYLQHVPLFCFPDFMRIVESPTMPPTPTNHSFTLTKEDGTKLHCACLITWEKPTGQLKTAIKYQSRTWYVRNINAADLEYLTHLRQQIQSQRSILAQLAPITEDDQLAMTLALDKLRLFTDLMRPFLTNACVDVEQLWVPRAQCLISALPIYDLMTDYLNCVHWGIMDNNGSTLTLEACLTNLIYEVPVPPPGRRELVIRAHSHDLHFSRPPLNDIPSLKNISFYPLFRTLPMEDIVFLLECILNEKRILFVSKHASLLNLTIQSLLLVMFPFTWFHPVISVVPFQLLSYLEAPVPFIMGLLACHLPLCDNLDDVVICHLDDGTVQRRVTKPPIPLPSRRRAKLLHRLRSSCQVAVAGPPLHVTEAFPLGRLVARSLQSQVPTSNAAQNGFATSFASPGTSPTSLASADSDEVALPVAASVLPASARRAASAGAARFFRRKSSLTSVASSADRDRGTPSPPLPAPPAGTSLAASTAPSIYTLATVSSRFSSPARRPTTTAGTPASVVAVAPTAPKKWVEGHALVEVMVRFPVAGPVCAQCDSGPAAGGATLWRCDACGMQVHGDCTAKVLDWCPKAFDENRVRRAFLKCFVSLLKNYRGFLGPHGMDTVGWISAQEADAQPFVRMLVETQAWMQFVQERVAPVEVGEGGGGTGAQQAAVDHEVIFLDEMIKVKRSKFSFARVDTSFFKDASLAVTAQYRCLAPQSSVQAQVHASFPLTSRAVAAQYPARVPDPLVTPQEEIMLTLYSAKLARQAKRPAGSVSSSEWLKKTAAQLATTLKAAAADPSAEIPLPISAGGETAAAVTRALVEERITMAWHTLKAHDFAHALASREDYVVKKRQLGEVAQALNELLLTCEQADLDDIVLITSQISKLVAHLDHEYLAVFGPDVAAPSPLPPKLAISIPSFSFEDLKAVPNVSNAGV
ncbi:hypothetical protein GGF31_004542 [Allomyces arbusculus]|nr:hypothetical protein GGF31_004542 [Allomyces arbusculus]